MNRMKRWMVLRNGQPVSLMPPNPLSEASARMLAEVLSTEHPEDELTVVEWRSDQRADWDAETDTVARYRGGAPV